MNPSNKKFTSMLILLVGLFVFVFFTQNIYGSMMDKKETYEKNKLEYKAKVEKNADLHNNANKLKENKGNIKLNNEIKKYLQKYSEDRIIRLFYNFSEKYDNGYGGIKIKSISLTEGKKNELGLKEATINITARVTNKKVMIDFLYFIINNPEYKFMIHNFTYPEETDTYFNINVPIKFLYQDFKKNVK